MPFDRFTPAPLTSAMGVSEVVGLKTAMLPGTSRLFLLKVDRLSVGLVALPCGMTGNLVSAPPLIRCGLRSRRIRLPGAGLVARLRLLADAIAACLSCSISRRGRSSVLNPRPRCAVAPPVVAASRIFTDDARFNSPKMSSLCANRSRSKR
jgi:hypothetical protein